MSDVLNALLSFGLVKGLLAILILFSVSIFVHELGHFMFMKLFGVRVERFAIGFGRRLFGVKLGETDYCVCILPFGGFVKPYGMYSKELETYMGEAEAPEAASEDGQSEARSAKPAEPAAPGLAESVADEVEAMRNKAWWQKVLILGAGCFNNVVTAMVVLALTAMIGFHLPDTVPAVVEEVHGVPSGTVDLRSGDRVVRVAGLQADGTAISVKAVDTEEAFDKAVIELAKKKLNSVALGVVRNGVDTTVTAALLPTGWPDPETSKIVELNGKAVAPTKKALQSAVTALLRNDDPTTVAIRVLQDNGTPGFETVVPLAALSGREWLSAGVFFRQPAFVAGVIPNLPAEKAGVKQGDTIRSVAGTEVYSQAHARSEIIKRVGQETAFVVDRPTSSGIEKKNLSLTVRPDPTNPTRGQIGIVFGTPRTRFVKRSFTDSFEYAWKQTLAIASANWEALGNVFSSGNIKLVRESVGGPIAIATMAKKAADNGVVDFVFLFVTFNIMLAIFNLMPIPVLDGGHIVFATIEALIGQPIPAKLFIAVHNVFIVLFIGLALMLSLNDVVQNLWRVW